MDFMMSCDGMKPPITSGGGGGGLQWPNKTLSCESRIFNAAGFGPLYYTYTLRVWSLAVLYV